MLNRVAKALVLCVLTTAGYGCSGDHARAQGPDGSDGTGVGDPGADEGAPADASPGDSGDSGADVARRAELVLPAVIDLPYVLAGTGPTQLTVMVENVGSADAVGPGGGALEWSLSPADPGFALAAAPTVVPAGGTAPLTVTFTGSAVEVIARATLTLVASDGDVALPIYAVVGDPGLGTAAFAPVTGIGGVVCGDGATIAMPAAPFPDGVASWTDDSVRVFLPEGWRDLRPLDVVVHFHGNNTTLAETLATHRYQEHLFASGQNAILVVPQGPVSAASGDFGKLMHDGGLARLIHEVLVLLYREGRARFPDVGTVILTSHSGGYLGVATNLSLAQPADITITEVGLFDSLYGSTSTFSDFATAGHRLRSSYTTGGGTLANNQTLAAQLGAADITVAPAPTQRALRDAGVVIDFAPGSSASSTRVGGIYGEELRFGLPRSRRGPRVELRQVVAQGGQAVVTWFSPPDPALEGFAVETSPDGVSFTLATLAGADMDHATFALSGGARVRVVARVTGVDPATALSSDVYRVDNDATLLVVDGFDRILDGAWGGLWHDFAARVGEAAGGVQTIAHRALTEDAFDLSPYAAVIWVAGDQSTLDQSLTAVERAALSAYLDAGGRLVATGSELAYDLHADVTGTDFLASAFGATYAADTSASYTVTGSGPLAGLGPIAFGGTAAPYLPGYPDVLAAIAGAQVLASYDSGQVGAVGLPHRGALVGFPLETCDSTTDLAALTAALLGFVGD